MHCFDIPRGGGGRWVKQAEIFQLRIIDLAAAEIFIHAALKTSILLENTFWLNCFDFRTCSVFFEHVYIERLSLT